MHMTLTEGLDDIQLQPFLVNKLTGVVSLNFDPQRGMKGYFDFMVRWVDCNKLCLIIFIHTTNNITVIYIINNMLH